MYYTYEGEPVEILDTTQYEYELYRYKGKPKHAWLPRFKEGQEIPLIPVMEDIIEPDADKLDFTTWKTKPYEHQKEFLKYSYPVNIYLAPIYRLSFRQFVDCEKIIIQITMIQ